MKFHVIICQNRYEDKLPPEWLEVWKAYGYGSFMNGYFRVINSVDNMGKTLLGRFKKHGIEVVE